MAIDKTLLNIYRGIAENNKRNSRKAEMICRGLKIPFKKEEFKSMSVFERYSDVDDSVIKCFKINTNKCEIEVDILEDRYMVSKRFNNNEYQFISQYLYEDNFLLQESFSIEGPEDTFAVIDECYPRSGVCVENDEKSISRFHIEDSHIDFENREIFAVKNYVNEITTNEEYEHTEIVYFLKKEDMYHYKVKKTKDIGMFLVGVSLGRPTYNMGYETMEMEESRIFNSLGMVENSIIKFPKLYFGGSYIEDDITHIFEINVLKNKGNFYIRIVEDRENQKILSVKSLNRENISIGELNLLKKVFEIKLENKPYIEWITNYFDEVISSAKIREEHNFRDISSYNADILDYLILEGKGIYGDNEGKNISLRAYELYERRNLIPKWLDSVAIKPLEIHKDKPLIMK